MRETVQVNRRIQITDTHPNRKYTTGAYIAGAMLSVAGVALLANAQGKSERVTCGSAPRNGDRCHSEAGAWRELGVVTLGTGLGTFIGGIIVHTRKRVVESKDLPSEERARVQSDRGACGDPEILQGATVRATLSSGGTWSGMADRTGAVQIDLVGAATLRGARAVFTLESVKSDMVGMPLAGASLGELELQPPRATSGHLASTRLVRLSPVAELTPKSAGGAEASSTSPPLPTRLSRVPQTGEAGEALARPSRLLRSPGATQ